MFEKIKYYFITGIICFIAGAVLSGCAIYFYTQNRVDGYRQTITEANDIIRKQQETINGLAKSADRIIELENSDRNRITRAKELSISLGDSISGAETINIELRKRLESYLDTK